MQGVSLRSGVAFAAVGEVGATVRMIAVRFGLFAA